MYCPSNVFRVIESRRTRRARYVARRGLGWANLKEGYYLGDLDVDERIILKFIIGKSKGMART
jgi:hypothetical protein